MGAELQIGEVVLNNDIPMVVIDCKNHEDVGSCAYDREYKLCTTEELRGRDLILDNIGMWITIRGITFPDIERVKDVAPYEIKKVVAYKVRQKQAKTITIYE